ncbi:hypothetical protein IMCC3317_40440 [Kordia antarctica]|uniref:Uncharacterized protein n=1 Tax=Kordia antarctica TaxID=1218801 RepID=A0A7L4ZQ66_9FLAO|nr:hypothetical protein IMCC3317_40440 [Kordia antarctica]
MFTQNPEDVNLHAQKNDYEEWFNVVLKTQQDQFFFVHYLYNRLW